MEKNIIKDSHIDAKMVRIGDEIHYHFNEGMEIINFELSHLSLERIIQNFNQASLHLSGWESEFENVPSSHIERKETLDLYNWIQTPLPEKEKGMALLVGTPGIGKTVILKDLLKRLQSEDIPVLGLKADRYYVESIKQLEERCALEDSIEKMVRTLLQEKEQVVILIDQIDALSQSLSSRREYMDTFKMLVTKLTDIKRVRVIISVRAFDLNYDTDLKLYRNQKSFRVAPLSKQEVLAILAKLKISGSLLSDKLFDLLRTPNHLNIFCKVFSPNLKIDRIHTLLDLYEELWSLKLLSIPSEANISSNQCIQLVFDLARLMYDRQWITIPKSALIEKYKEELIYLQSEGIVIASGNDLQFFHQSFYDYAIAKQFVENEYSIQSFLKENHQGLFVRSKLKMIVAFLREKNRTEYIKLYRQILFSKQYRFHLKSLLISLLGFIERPTKEEIAFVKNKLLKNNKFKRLFLEAAFSTEWFKILLDEKQYELLLTTPKNLKDYLFELKWISKNKVSTTLRRHIKYVDFEKRSGSDINLCYSLLSRQLPQNRNLVLRFIQNLPESSYDYRLIERLIWQIKIWDNPIAFELFEKYKEKPKIDDFIYYNILKDALNNSPEWVIKQVKIDLNKFYKNTESSRIEHFLSHHEMGLYKAVFERFSEKFFDLFLPIVKSFIKITRFKDRNDVNSLYHDFTFFFFDYGNIQSSRDRDELLKLFINSVKWIAKEKPSKFRAFVNKHLNHGSSSIFMVIAHGFLANPSAYCSEILIFINKFETKGGFYQDGKLQYFFRQLLTQVYPYFSIEEKEILNKKLLNIHSKDELYIWENRRNGKKRLSPNYGKRKFLYLQALPESELFQFPILKQSYLELKRKFGAYKDSEPNSFGFNKIAAPIEKVAAEKMTLEDWRKSITKYNTEYQSDFESYTGGLFEHANTFREEVKKRPDFFYPFMEDLVNEGDAPLEYTFRGLYGLKEANYNPKKLLVLFNKLSTFDLPKRHINELIWLTDHFIKHKVKDENFFRFLLHLALHHQDPEEDIATIKNEKDENESVFLTGVKSIRGAAARKLTSCYYYNDFHEAIFQTVEKIAERDFVSVKTAVISNLALLMNLDKERTLKIFLLLVKNNDEPIINQSIWSAQHLARYNFEALLPYYKNALNYESTIEGVATILALAWMDRKDGSTELLESALKRSTKARAKMPELAAINMINKDGSLNTKSLKLFERFMNEEEDTVIKGYDIAFHYLKPESFLKTFPMLERFMKSKAAQRNPLPYYEYLFKCAKQNPIGCLALLSNFDNYEFHPISSAGYYDKEPVKTLIGAYTALMDKNHRANSSYIKQALNVFDRMLQNDRFRGFANDVVRDVES